MGVNETRVSENRLNGFENGKTQLFNFGGGGGVGWVLKWAYFQKKWNIPLRFDHIYHCWVNPCGQNPVISTGIHTIRPENSNEGERFLHSDFATGSNWLHWFVALTKRESCLIRKWVLCKWLLCELCLVCLERIIHYF